MNTKKIGNTTYKRNEDGDWEEKITNTITRIYPCCGWIDCDFFSTTSNDKERHEEYVNHERTVHANFFEKIVEETRQENKETS